MLNSPVTIHQVEPIIRKAGEIVLSYFHKKLTWHEKDQGFVTQADLESERFLIQELSKVLPEASFFAEESGRSKGENDYCWVIDPLDGTTNFAHGLPYFCISIALTYHNKPIFGVIYQPLLNELFYAQEGQGAYLNGQRISVAQEVPLDKSFLLVGLPYEKDQGYKRVMEHLQQISPRTYAFRHMGAIALDQAYLACGRADGLFFEGLSWWDIAAGILLIKEAGGMVTTYEGDTITITFNSFLAAPKKLYRILLPFFKGTL